MDNAVSPSVISLNIKKIDQGLSSGVGLLDYLARKGNKPGALFQWQDGTPLFKTWFVDAVRQALTAAHFPVKDYADHSFRIGAATTATMAGLEDSVILTLGRWKSTSYKLYIMMDLRQLASLSSSLSSCNI